MHYEAELVILFLFLGLVCEGYVICRVEEGNGTGAREVTESHILTHSLIRNCALVWCDGKE